MGFITIPDQDSKYRGWLQNFANIASEYSEELGFTPEQIEAMAEFSENFALAYEASNHARNAAMGATATKRETRERSEEFFREMAKRVVNNGDVPSLLVGRLGLGVEKAPPSPVTTPSNLVVSGNEVGINRLRWQPNGNSRSVTYIIEFKIPGQADWQILTATSTLKYDHLGQVPGQQIAYRVSAKRSKIQSAPCAAVSVYYGVSSGNASMPIAA